MRYALAVMLAVALSACGRSSGIELQPPEALTARSAAGAAPIFAMSPSGSRTVGWISAPEGGSDGRLYTLTGGAKASELRDTIGGIEAHGESPPKLTYAPDGTLYALYVVAKVEPGRRFPFSTLRLAASHDGGVTWAPPVRVMGDSLPGSRNFHAMHAASDGSLYVAWLESRDERKSGTYITRSTDGGQTWSPAVRADVNESCPCCRTAIATAPDGTLYLAWRTVMPGNVRDIVVASSKDHGGTWGPARRVHADEWVFDGCPHAGPSLQVGNNGVVHVAWWTGKEGAAGAYYTRSVDGGVTFGVPEALGTAAFTRPEHVQLALDGPRTVLAAWDDGRDSLPKVLLRVSRDGGASFGPVELASEPAAAASFPVIALRNGQLTVAWSEQSREASEHEDHTRPNMKDPKAVMPLAVVGERKVVARKGVLRASW